MSISENQPSNTGQHDEIIIRDACITDAEALAAFNQAIARETENIELRHEVISAGVAAILENPALGFYTVAEHGGKVVGSLMVTTEWSDWRNGVFWWVQSVYVSANMRRRGIYRRLYNHVKKLADSAPNVCGFRLYVEQDNTVAQSTYQSMGMNKTAYRIFEDLGSDIDFIEK